MRVVLVVLFAAGFAAFLAACSTQVTSVGIGGTVSLADTGHSGPTAGLAAVEVEAIVLGSESGWSSIRAGSPFFCYDPVDLEIEASGDTAYPELAYSANQGLRAEGIPVESGGPGGSDGAAYLLRGRVGFSLNWCQLSFGIVEVDGDQSTYWELYSLLDQKVVYSATITTEISIREAKSARALILRALELSVEQSARNLARARGFRKVLAEAPPAAAANPQGAPATSAVEPDDAPITIARLPLATGAFQANSAKIQGATVVLERKGHGSGFFISKDGYILTNAHVVGGAEQIRVELLSGEVLVGQVVRRNKQRDVALVKVTVPSAIALPLRLALPAVGEDVFAVGAPLDQYLTGTVTKGIVSALRVDADGARYIQADVDIQEGNSGGPLTDAKGNVLGLAVLGIQTGSGGSIGLNFFVPIEDALRALDVVVQ
jgi:S1-C subfamily serine protease